MTDLEAGSLYGRYRIERRLGSGGFGDVYLATDTNPQLPRRVALKILKRELARDPSFRDRFIRESSLAIEIDHHPNIVPVYDAGEEDGTLFIAMRFVPGQNLQEQLAAHGRLSPARCVEVINAISSALDVAHAVGIVHRDVKPANILINEETDQIYLADLGLTKRVDAESVLTMTGMFMGTLSYASPEQLDDQMVDARSDVYSLGCVLFECLTGRPPFVGGLDAVIAAHIRKEPPKVTEYRPEVGPAIDDVIAKALAKSPADRYQRAGELGAAAARALSLDRPWGPPPLPPTVVTPQPPAMPTPAPPYSSSPAPPPFPPSTAAAPAPPPYLPPPVTQGPGGPGGSAPRRSNKKPLIIAGGVAIVVLLGIVGVVIAVTGGSDDPVATTTTTDSTTTTTTGTNSSEDQRALLAHVPEAIQDSCHGENAAAPATVELGCNSADGKTFLLYDQYASAADLRAAYESQRSGIAIDSGDPSAGDCPGEGRLDGDDRITCEDRNPAKWLHWTDYDLLIMSAASPYDDATPWKTLTDQVPELSPVGSAATP